MNTWVVPMDLPSGQRRIEAELVDIFHRNVPNSVLALNPLLAGLLAWLLLAHADWRLLAAWVGLIALVALVNADRNRRYRLARARESVDVAEWRGEFNRAAVLNGIAWGLGGAIFYSPAAPLPSMFVLLVICGVAAGSVAAQSSLPRTLVSFLIPAMLIPAVRALMFLDGEHAALAALLVAYLVFLSFVARSNHRTLLDATNLRFHNQSLLDALTDRERHFRSLIENALDWVSVVSADNTFLFLSPSVAELLGWQPDELQGRDALSLVHPDERAQVLTEFRRVFAHGGSAAIEARWHHREAHWVVFQGLVRCLGGEPPTLVMNARDVTKRRAIEHNLRAAKEAAEAASRVKDQFLASMSHEIRTPLHAMQGMADLLRDTPLTTRQLGYVAGFQQAVGHLTRLVDDVLDFSRMNAGGLTLACEVFDLHALLEGVVDMMGPQARAKGLPLHLACAAEIPAWRLGDVVRLRQILVNLVGNAVKFTDRGEVRVTVEEKGDGFLQFSVSDTGRGIPPDKQELLFRAFYQVDASSTRQYGGVGLGLAISRGLVEAMGGQIGLESRPGAGSVFRFAVRLPAANASVAQAAAMQAGLPPRTRILVVDDAELNLMVIREFFRDSQCRLDFARTGREAVEAWEREHHELVLMDIQMPEMDGWEATKIIRARERQQGLRPTTIIVLTAGALDEDRAKSLAVGCSDFLSKPVSKGRLLALLAAHLDTSRQEAADRASSS